MRRKTPVLFLGILLLMSLVLVLLFSEKGGGTGKERNPVSPKGKRFPGVTERTLAPIQDPGARMAREEFVSFRVVDRLTGEPLSLSDLRLVEGGTVHNLEGPPFQVRRFLLEKSGSLWRYLVPLVGGTLEYQIPVAEAIPDDGKVALPYKSGVRGRIAKAFEGGPIFGAEIKVFLFERKKLDQLQVEMGLSPDDLPLAAFFASSGERHYRRAYGSLETLATRSHSDGSFQLVLPVSGTFVLMSSFANRATKITSRKMVPGAWTEWDPILESRPVVEGQVFDEKGEGVPKCHVEILSLVDPSTQDFADPSQMGAAVINLGDGNPTYVAKKVLLTKPDGTFSSPMPRGTRYAVQVVRGAESDFREASSLEAEKDLVHIDLFFGKGLNEHPLKLQFSDGSPIVGASIRWTIPDDFPWFRQFPAYKEGKDGMVQLPIVESGKKIGIFLSGGNLSGRFFADVSPEQGVLSVPLEKKEQSPFLESRQKAKLDKQKNKGKER